MAYEITENEMEGGAVSRGRDLTAGSIPRHLIAFAIPLLLNGILTNAYSGMNAYWVGNFLGKNPMAAITIGIWVYWLIVAPGIGVTTAANILVAQAYGARDWAHLRRVVQNAAVLTIVVSFACSIIGVIFIKQILHAMSTEVRVMPLATLYMKVFMWTTPPLFMIYLMSAFLLGVGDSKTSTYFMASLVVVNGILDPLLMRGLFGFPNLGLMGAAVSAMAADILIMIVMIIYLQCRYQLVAPDWGNLRSDLETSWLMVKIGGPAMLQQFIGSFTGVFILGLVNKYGANATAGLGVGNRIDGWAFFMAMMVGNSVTALAGQNVGLRQYDRVKEVFRWGLIMACGMTMLLLIMAVCMSDWTIHLFIKDPAVIRAGAGYLRIIGFIYVMFGIMLVSNGVINGSGHTFVPTIISLIYLWGIQIPLAVFLSERMHKLEGIWYAVLISYAVGTLLTALYYYSGRWKKPIVKHAIDKVAEES